MNLTVKKVSFEPPKLQLKNTKPTIIPWNDTDIIRIQAIKPAIKEIVRVSKSLDVVKIGIIGNQNTGKSTQLGTIGHLIHEESDIPFAVKILGKYDLLNLQDTISNLSPTNWIIGFDDTSFLGAQANKKQLDIVKQISTEIRHLPGGQDVKIIQILNYHYTLGMDKYLRQGEFKFFTSVGSSEVENMERIVGAKYMPLVRDFKKMYTRMLISGKFSFMLGDKPFTYRYRDPFIPMLFWNEDTLRIVVSPTRQWANKDQPCTICSNAEDNQVFGEIDEKRFIDEGRAKWGRGAFDSAFRIKLHDCGIDTAGVTVEQCRKWIDKAFQTKIINLEKAAVYGGFHVKKTQLHKKLDGMFTEPSQVAN